MHIATIVLIGIMFSCATYLLLQHSFIKILFVFALLSHATNLVILSISGHPLNKLAPIVTDTLLSFVDPLPQALILTAIVISFGVTAYLVVLFYRISLESETTDSEKVFKQ